MRIPQKINMLGLSLALALTTLACKAEKKPEKPGPTFCGDSGCAQAESNRKMEAAGVKNEASFKAITDVALKPIQCSSGDATYLIQNHNLFSSLQGFEGRLLSAFNLTLSANQASPDLTDPQAKCQYNVGDADHTRAFIVYGNNLLAVYPDQLSSSPAAKPVYYDMTGPLGVTTSYFESEMKKDTRAPAEVIAVPE